MYIIILSACVVFFYSYAPAKDEAAADEKTVESDSSDYGEYPRARYKSLLDDFEFLREEKFSGRVFPVRFVRVPWELRQYAGSGHSLLYVQTMRRKYPMYVIVPNNRAQGIRDIIEAGEELRCVYSPVSIYRLAPVILFVDGAVAITSPEEKEEMAQEPEQKKKPLVAVKPKTEVPEKPRKTAEPEKSKKTAEKAKPGKADVSAPRGLASYYPCPKGAQWTVSIGKDVRMLEYEILDVMGNEAQGLKREMVPNKPELDRTSDYRVVFNKNNITAYEQGVDPMGNPYDREEILLEEPLQTGKKWTVEIDKVTKYREIVAVDTTVTAGREENPVTYNNVIIVREDVKDEKFFAVVYSYYGANVGFIGCKIDSSDKKESLKKHDEITEWFMMRTN